MAQKKTVCVLGGTGFVGMHLANQLSKAGYQVRIPSRRRERHRDVLVVPTVDVVDANVHDSKQLESLVSGCDVVINLVAILNERKRGDFQRVHVELPSKVVNACKTAGVGRLLHMSSLNADPVQGPSRYLRSKGEGQKFVLAAQSEHLAVTVFRPSIIFGPGDNFFNMFASFLSLTPLIFPVVCPNAKFAPVYVGDVAKAMVDAIAKPASYGRAFNLCGPGVYRMQQLVEYVNQVIGARRAVIGLGDGASRLMATVLGMVPGSPMTTDNYLSMQIDSVCDRSDTGAIICSNALESIVPYYVGRKDQRSLYDAHRTVARHDSLPP